MDESSRTKDKVLINVNMEQSTHQDTESLLIEYENVIRMTFSTEDEGCDFFNKYAKQKGFSIRKDVIKRNSETGMVVYRRLLCSRAGSREKKYMSIQNRKRKERALSRCECPVHFCIQLHLGSGTWFVHDFEDQHNHELVGPDEVTFLRSHRKIDEVQRSDIIALQNAGLRNHQIMAVMEHKYGGLKNVGFISKDLYNFSSRKKKSRFPISDSDTVSKSESERQEENMQLRRYRILTSLGSLVFYEASKSEESYQELMAFLKDKLKHLNKANSKTKDADGYNISSEGSQDEEAMPSVNVLDQVPAVSNNVAKKRMKSSHEVRIHRCGHCHRPGHTKCTCPAV